MVARATATAMRMPTGPEEGEEEEAEAVRAAPPWVWDANEVLITGYRLQVLR